MSELELPTADGGDERTTVATRSRLVSAVDLARGRLTGVPLPLEGSGVERARKLRRATLDQIDDYLLPRLRSDGAPLLVVVGGSTGAGKSTLVNSLLGAPLTTPGVLRPTTRSPVLVFHPADAPWFAPERILPGLQRVHTTTSSTPNGPGNGDNERLRAGEVRSLRLAPFPAMPPGLALLDAPDIDSVEVANRDLAGQLLAAADLWLFVTTAARYADAVPWDLLGVAARRHAQIALVIDRIDPGSAAVVADLDRMMGEHGLGEAPLFAVPEIEMDEQGLLPERAIADIAGWLSDLGGDAAARGRVALATRDGVVGELAGSLRELAQATDDQAASAQRLTAMVTTAYEQAQSRVSDATADGAMLRGEVLERWQDFVGASGFIRSIDRGVSKVRDVAFSFFRGGEPSAKPVELAIAHGLEAVVIDAVEGARERVRSAWRADPAGSGLVVDASATAGVTGVSTAELRGSVADQIRGWQSDVLHLVGEQGASKRGLARGLSLGVNGLGVALMLVVFAGTGGLSGIEIGIAGGTAVAAQKVLEAVFGDDAVRRLTKQAAARLNERLGALLQADAAIALTAIAALGLSADAGEELRAAAAQLELAEDEDRAQRPTELPASRSHAPVPMLRGANLRGQTAQLEAGPGSTGLARLDQGTDDPGVDTQKRPGIWKWLFGADS